MKELFQKHRKRIIGGVIAICLLGGGGYYYVHTNIPQVGLKRAM